MSALSRKNFRFFHRLRVRWAEVDVQKIVFNPHYLTYVDTAMSGYWNALALPYVSTMQSLQAEIFLKKVTIDFQASAMMDDDLDIALHCSRIGTSSITFQAAIFRAAECLVVCDLVYVYADALTQKSQPVPDALRSILTAYEAGEPMVKVSIGDWDTWGQQAGRVRMDVFIQEQKIPIEEEWDAADAVSLHAVAHNRLGVAVATARLLPSVQQVSRVGRMAVTRALRGTGVGQWVLQHVLEAAIQRQDKYVELHAQKWVEGFYVRHGFVTLGESFEEVGIEHVVMRKNLYAA
jgi:YbgC/YbaW family acyl-CoA thioester hydrolase